MKFKEFSDATGLPVRELRYLMSIGIIPPGKERGRFADAFDETHIAAAKRYRAFAAAGLNARQIAALTTDSVPSTLVLRTACLELHILPGTTARDIDADAIQTFLKQAEAALAACRQAIPLAPTAPPPAKE